MPDPAAEPEPDSKSDPDLLCLLVTFGLACGFGDLDHARSLLNVPLLVFPPSAGFGDFDLEHHSLCHDVRRAQD